MQRRAAALYATFFLLIAVGAFVMIGVAEEPTADIDDPDVTVSVGESFAVDGRTYNESNGVEISGATAPADRSAVLVWINASERQTATFENQSELAAADVIWDDQTARQIATFENGTTIVSNGTEYTLVVGDGEITLRSGDQSDTYPLGESVRYGDNETTVVGADGSATLAWGEPYNVTTQTATNDSFDFRETFNVTDRLRSDSAVDNETVTRADGREYVVYRDGTVELLSSYLPEPEVVTFSEGEMFTYNTAEDGVTFNEVTVANVSAERVLVSWRGPVGHAVVVENGANVTLGPNDRQYVAYFPENETLELSTDVGAYQDKLKLQDSYWLRITGLWGISILSGLAAMLIVAGAYLPSRY